MPLWHKVHLFCGWVMTLWASTEGTEFTLQYCHAYHLSSFFPLWMPVVQSSSFAFVKLIRKRRKLKQDRKICLLCGLDFIQFKLEIQRRHDRIEIFNGRLEGKAILFKLLQDSRFSLNIQTSIHICVSLCMFVNVWVHVCVCSCVCVCECAQIL